MMRSLHLEVMGPFIPEAGMLDKPIRVSSWSRDGDGGDESHRPRRIMTIVKIFPSCSSLTTG